MPVLLFEAAWKILWLALVAVPRTISGDIDPATAETASNCLLVVAILAVIPWRHVWRHYVHTTGDRWARMTATPPDFSVPSGATPSTDRISTAPSNERDPP